jgi:hypothetical protein
MNNTIILNHHGLFIYIDIGYPNSYYHVSILLHSNVYRDWREYFIHEDEYFEYLLGDLSHVGEKMFVMYMIE